MASLIRSFPNRKLRPGFTIAKIVEYGVFVVMMVAVLLWQHAPTTSQVDRNVLIKHSLVDTVINGVTKYVKHDYDQTYVYDTILIVDVHYGTDTIEHNLVYVKHDSISIDGRSYAYPGAIDYSTVTVLYSEFTSYLTYQDPITKRWMLQEVPWGSQKSHSSRPMAGAPVAFIRKGAGYLLTESGELFSTDQGSIIRLDSGLLVPSPTAIYGQSARSTYRTGWQYEVVAGDVVSYQRTNGDWGIAHSQMTRGINGDRIIPIDYEYDEYGIEHQIAFASSDTIVVIGNPNGGTPWRERIVKCVVPPGLVSSVKKVCIRTWSKLNDIAVVTQQGSQWYLLRYCNSETKSEVLYAQGQPIELGTAYPRVAMFSRAATEKYVFVSYGTYCEGNNPGYSLVLNLESGDVVYKGDPVNVHAVRDQLENKGRDTLIGVICVNNVRFKYDLHSRRMLQYEAVTVECTSIWPCDDDPDLCIEALSVTYTNKTDNSQRISAIEIESVENLEDYSKKRKVLYRSDHSVNITLGPREVLPVDKLFLKSKVRFYDGRQPHFYARVK